MKDKVTIKVVSINGEEPDMSILITSTPIDELQDKLEKAIEIYNFRNT